MGGIVGCEAGGNRGDAGAQALDVRTLGLRAKPLTKE